MLRMITAVTAALVVTTGAAHATTLGTPLVGSGARSQCIVTNVGTKPTAVTVKLYDANGDDVTLSDSCAFASPIAPHASCAVSSSAGQVVACTVESTSRSVRAALEVFDAAGVITVVPATAK